MRFLNLSKFMLVLTLAYCILFVAGCSKPKDSFTPPSLPSSKLNAEVSVWGEKITIVNKDTFAWKDPLVTISGGGTSKYYRIAIEDFEAGEKKIYSINKFINVDGDSYDVTSQPILNVVIQAQDANGKEFGYRHYF